MNIIQDFKRESRFDPDLARRLNEQVEQEEKREKLKEKLKAKKTPEQPEQKEPLIIPAANLQDPEDYILLQQTRDHPDILIAKYRLGLNAEVEQVAKQLSLTLQNTAKEQNGHDYLGNINHPQSLDLAKALSFFTLPVSYFREHLRNLREGFLGNILVYDGKGKKLERKELEALFNEITEVRSPWRAEWLNDRCIEKKKDIYVVRNKFDSSGKLTEATEQLDKDALRQNKLPGISLDEWLNNSTEQGLPRKNIQDGSLYYWNPVANSVARFDADSDGAFLGYSWYPWGSYAVLGVRVARVK